MIKNNTGATIIAVAGVAKAIIVQLYGQRYCTLLGAAALIGITTGILSWLYWKSSQKKK